MAYEDTYCRIEQPLNLGVPNVFTLPQGLNILKGTVELEATVTITGTANSGAAGTAVREGGPIGLVRRILVQANKAANSRYVGGALVNCHPQSLVRFAMTERSGKFVGELSGSTLGGGVNGVYNIFLSIPIYFADSLTAVGVETALNARAQDTQGNGVYPAIQVKVDIAQTLGEIFSGTSGAMTVAGMVRWSDQRLDLGAQDTVPLKQEDHDLLIMAKQERLVDAAMPNDGAFESWLLMAQQGVPAWALSDAIINRVEVRGESLNFKQNWQEIRQTMIDDGYYDPSSNMTGQFFIDFAKGTLKNLNKAAGLEHHFSVNNPTGSGEDAIRVYTRRAYGLG